MIAKKQAGGIIKIYKTECNEIESFTMLHISEDEFNQLLKVADWTMDNDNVLVAHYVYKDPLDMLWKDLATAHKNIGNKFGFQDVSKVYESSVSGTSALVRDPVKHIIKICYRNGNNTNKINRVCIDNDRRDLFFRDCYKATYYDKNEKYGIDLADETLYNYWSEYMNKLYVRGKEKLATTRESK